MSYSLLNNAQLDERISSDLNEICECLQALPEFDNVISIILVGGYGRGEGTALFKGNSAGPYNDYDLVLVTTSSWNPFKIKKFKRVLSDLSRGLEQKLGIAIDLMPISVNDLSHAKPTLFNTEMRLGHKVLYGPPQSLFTMPELQLHSLPKEEGLRLLMNRAMLLILIENDLKNRERRLRYIHKNHLALGDALLILNSQNRLHYSEKADLVDQLVQESVPKEFAELAQWYRQAIDFKIYGKLESYQRLNTIQMYEQLREMLPFFILWFESMRLKKEIRSTQDLSLAYSLSIGCNPKILIKAFLMYGPSILKFGISALLRKPLYSIVLQLMNLLQKPINSIGQDGNYSDDRKLFLKLRGWVG